MLRIVLAILTLPGCYLDVATVVNVSPSAEHKMDAIFGGVDIMNEQLERDVFTVRSVDSSEARDGEIVVRFRDEPFKVKAQTADTERRTHGVIISVMDRCTALCIAHELGHAAGLEHVEDEDNMMHVYWGHTYLTDDQKESILLLDEDYRMGRAR